MLCGAIAELRRHEYKNPRSSRVEETSRAGKRENQVTYGDRNTDRDPHQNNTTVTGCDLHRTDSEGTKGCVGCFEVLSKPNKIGASDRRGMRVADREDLARNQVKLHRQKKSEAEAVERGRSRGPKENETKKIARRTQEHGSGDPGKLIEAGSFPHRARRHSTSKVLAADCGAEGEASNHRNNSKRSTTQRSGEGKRSSATRPADRRSPGSPRGGSERQRATADEDPVNSGVGSFRSPEGSMALPKAAHMKSMGSENGSQPQWPWHEFSGRKKKSCR